MPDWLEKAIIALTSLAAGIFGKPFFDYLTNRRKAGAEAQHITIESELSLLQMSDRMARDYMSMFNEAANELRQSRAHQQNAATLIRKMLGILKQVNYENWEQLEQEAEQILKT